MTMRPGLTKSVIWAAIIAWGLFLCMASVANAYTVPQPGVYTFAFAITNPDGTITTADGFFIIDRHDGSGANSIVAADAYGAYIFSSNAAGTSYTSYLEVRVNGSGSFSIEKAKIGEYNLTGITGTNNFTDVYLAGYANDNLVCETNKISSIGKYETEYTSIDYSPCAGKAIDKFRVFYTVQTGGVQNNFSLANFTLMQASSTPVPQQNSTISPTAANFDKYGQGANYKDVAVTITPNGNSLVNVMLGASTLSAGTAYTTDGNTVTLKKEYLATLGTGSHVFTFDMSGGNDPTLTVTISDTTPSDPGQPDDPSDPSDPDDPGDPSDPSEPSQPSQPSQPVNPGVNEPEQTVFPLIVNGRQVDSMATVETSRDGDITKLTATIDKTKLEEELESEEDQAVIIVPLGATQADHVVSVLTAETIKIMESKQAILEVQTIHGNYRLPAGHVDVDLVASEFGEVADLSQIVINVEVSRSDESRAELAEAAAAGGNFAVVVPPVDFKITAVYDGRTIGIDRFKAYIVREIPLPEGVDPSRITTAVIVEDDGAVRHVPTYLTKRDGVYYAVVSSLTNSVYTLVWHPMSFADVENHWSKDAVNDMASRMIVKGAGDTGYKPNQSITRAEFAAIMVRALGLADNGGTAPFRDVRASDWFAGAVAKAYEYGLIQGFGDGAFRPLDTITRQETVAILSRVMKWTGLPGEADIDKTLSRFADSGEVAAWARDALAAAVEHGLVQGNEQGLLNPNGEVTRAEAAALVQRLLRKSGMIN